MHKLEKLLNNGEAELVLKLTENTTDWEELLFRTRALRMLNRLKEVPEIFDLYHDVLNQRLDLTMPVHIAALIDLGEFDEARKAIGYYANLPYQNQIVEEMIRGFPRYIDQEEMMSKNKNRGISDEEVAELLMSDKDDEVLTGLEMVKTRRVDNFIPEFEKIFKNKHKAYVRGMALALANHDKIDKDFSFLDWNEVPVKINPIKIEEPFKDKVFDDVYNRIKSSNDITYIDIAERILFTYEIGAYPYHMDESSDMIYATVRFVALQALMQSINIDELVEKYHLDKAKLEAHIARATSFIR